METTEHCRENDLGDAWGFPRRVSGRLWHVAFSVALLAVCSPVLVICIIAIKLERRGKAIFKQGRIGKDGKPFTIYKLRTMYPLSPDTTDCNTELSHTETRISKFGFWLRMMKIDELPQLLNILKGDMNFVGPRPVETTESHDCVQRDPRFKKRYAIKPGLTGPRQIVHLEGPDAVQIMLNGLECELNYIRNKGPLLDLIIILSTMVFIAQRILEEMHHRGLLAMHRLMYCQMGSDQSALAQVFQGSR